MYHRILLAFDGSQAGREALRQGEDLARLCGAEVVLLAVVVGQIGVAPAEAIASAEVIALEHRATQQLLDEGAHMLRQAGLSVRTSLRAGHPAEEIGRAARDTRADLIVVGHREQGTLARWWGGSTGASLLAHAPCSVLVAVAVHAGHAKK
jgi:nucleotide-binding universal stress UspA family protein